MGLLKEDISIEGSPSSIDRASSDLKRLKRTLRRRSSSHHINPSKLSTLNKSKDEFFSDNEGSTGSFTFQKIEIFENTTVAQIAFSFIIFLLVSDYIQAFDNGEPLFITDTFDILTTCLYLRQSFSKGFGWKLNDLQIVSSDRVIEAKIKVSKLIYAFISMYFFYTINTAGMRAILFLNPSYLYRKWTEPDNILKFLLLGFIPTYYFPNDILYRYLYFNSDLIPKLIRDGTWSISKIDSLKRTILLYQDIYDFNGFFSLIVLLPHLVVGCQLSSILKKFEINIGQNGFLDISRFINELFRTLYSTSTFASIAACTFLSSRFVLVESEESFFLVLLDISALLSLYYRYAHESLINLFSRSGISKNNIEQSLSYAAILFNCTIFSLVFFLSTNLL